MFCEMCEVREYYDAKKDYAIMKASEVLAGIDWNQYLFFFQRVKQFAFVEFFVAQIKKESISSKIF